MKDKRTYNKLKEHGEDMSHENESKADPKEDRGALDLTLLTEQYRAELHKYKEREGLHIQTENQLKGTKQIVIEMAGTIRQIHSENENLKAEVSRLLEQIQLLEMKMAQLEEDYASLLSDDAEVVEAIEVSEPSLSSSHKKSEKQNVQKK